MLGIIQAEEYGKHFLTYDVCDLIFMYVSVLCGMSRDKDVRECLKSLLLVASCDDIYFAQVYYHYKLKQVILDTYCKSGNYRALPVETLKKIFLETAGTNSMSLFETDGILILILKYLLTLFLLDLESNVRGLIEKCASDTETNGSKSILLICGTAYFMPQIRSILGISEPRLHFISNFFLFLFFVMLRDDLDLIRVE